MKRKSFFILAMGGLDEERLSGRELLKGYKGQGKVERGFRFMKDSWFIASSLFLENEERIMVMVMTLCPMMYAALQHRIRQGLQAGERSYLDQKGIGVKETA